MLNININYPYPVIREYTDDYQSTEFIGELKVLLEPDGYAVHTNFEINNKGIQILLSKRFLHMRWRSNAYRLGLENCIQYMKTE